MDMEKESVLFTPGKIGPLTLRNRTIRAAAFESMCPGNAPSDIWHAKPEWMLWKYTPVTVI